MSGQLIGELGTARGGHLADLTPVEFLALLAIANRCAADSREGWCSWSEIERWTGKSRSTAERAVKSLKDKGIVWIPKRGYNTHGRVSAPRYSICEIPAGESASVTQMTETDDVLPSNDDVLPSFSQCASVKTAMCFRHPDDGLDGHTDGQSPDLHLDEGDAREREHPTRHAAPSLIQDVEPPLFCQKHPNGTDRPCPPCGNARRIHDAWDRNQPSKADRKAAGWAALAQRFADPDYESPLGELFGSNKGPKRNDYIDGEVLDADPVQALFEGRSS